MSGGERAFQKALLDRAIPVTYRRARPEDSTLRAPFVPYRDPQSWLDVGFSLFAWFVATVTWSLALAWWSAALGGLSAPLWAPFTDRSTRFMGIPTVFGGQPTAWILEILANRAVGVRAAVTLPWVIHAMASLQSLSLIHI